MDKQLSILIYFEFKLYFSFLKNRRHLRKFFQKNFILSI